MRKGESYYWKPPTAPTNPKPFALCARTKKAKQGSRGTGGGAAQGAHKVSYAAPGIVGQHTVDDIRNGF